MTCMCGHTVHIKHVWQRGPGGTRARVRTYICGDPHRRGRGHTTLRAETAENAVSEAMFGVMLGVETKRPDESAMRAVQAELAALAQDRAAATSALLERGTDKGVVRARLAQIEAATGRVEAERDRLAVTGSALQRTLDAMEFGTGIDSEEHLQTFLASWDDVPWEDRRELVRTYLDVKIMPGGQGAKRLAFDFK
jgi:hypothetical protein